MKKNPTQNKVVDRDNTLDLIRGVAVIAMLATHIIAFFYGGNSPILLFIRWFGDVIAFTMFLFVSSIVSYVAYLNISDEEWNSKKSRFIKRILWMYVGYEVISIFSLLKDFGESGFIEIIKKIFFALTFIYPPEYSEFIITFILFSLLIYLFRNQLIKVFNSKIYPIAAAIIIYLIAIPLYYANWGSTLEPVKALLVGQEGMYRFPLFQYFPIFILGLYFGKLLVEEREKLVKTSLRELLCMIPLLISFAFIPILRTIPYSIEFGRWPPTVSFLSIGIFSSLVAFYVLRFLPTLIKDIVSYLGQKSFLILVIHISIFELVKLFFDIKSISFYIVAFASFIFLIVLWECLKIVDNIKNNV